jgi:phosphoglycolate phosphatase
VYKMALLDWDGTLVRSHIAFIKLYNAVAEQYGYKRIHDDDIARFTRLSMRERLRALGIPFYRIPGLIRKVKQAQRRQNGEVDAVPGIQEVLQVLRKQGMELHILSSNSRETIERLAAELGFPVWDSIQGDVPLFGKHRAIRRFMKEKGVGRDQVVYIGDECRDMEACRRIGVPMIAVTWGYDAEALLVEGQPNAVVREPPELLPLLLQS